MKKFWDVFLNVCLVVALVIIVFGVLYSIILPFDHYKVRGRVYRTDDWSCQTGGFTDGETKILVSCEKRDGSEKFSVMTSSFSVVDSMFEK